MCDHCGGLNHFAKDCQASDIVCHNCSKHGHIARDCPVPYTMDTHRSAPPPPATTKTCYVCGKPGHIARNCIAVRRERDEDDSEEGADTTDSEASSGVTDSEEESESDA